MGSHRAISFQTFPDRNLSAIILSITARFNSIFICPQCLNNNETVFITRQNFHRKSFKTPCRARALKFVWKPFPKLIPQNFVQLLLSPQWNNAANKTFTDNWQTNEKLFHSIELRANNFERLQHVAIYNSENYSFLVRAEVPVLVMSVTGDDAKLSNRFFNYV